MPFLSESNLLQSLGWALINSLWQMALLWVIYQVILSLSSFNAKFRVNLAVAFLLTGFGWFLLTFLKDIVNGDHHIITNAIAGSLIGEKSLQGVGLKILPFISGVYLILLALPVWRFARNYRYVKIVREQGLRKISVEWRMFVDRIAGHMGIRRKVRVWLSEIVQSPVTIGFFKPIILIPVAAINQLSPQQVEAILLHELSHIRSNDYFFNLVINFIRTILYFNPFVNLFVKSIEKEREISCDEMVMQFQYEPIEYASALLLFQKNVVSQSMIMAVNGKHNLLSRIEKILGIDHKDRFSARRLVGAVAVFICMLSLNAILFIGSQNYTGGFAGFVQDHNPYYFMNAEKRNEGKEATVKSKTETIQISNQETLSAVEVVAQSDNNDPVENADPADFKFVNYTSPVIPILAEEDEAKIQETMKATRKILEEKEWKNVEKSYAELLNSTEKSILKDEFLAKVEDFDWNKLENQLKLSYDQINWPKVNEQVQISLAQIRVDSVYVVLSKSLVELDKLEVWMNQNKATSIPDTDITISTINENQKKLKLELDRLKNLKNRKIVNL